MQLWSSGNVITTVQEHYEQLAATALAETLLRRVWTHTPGYEDA